MRIISILKRGIKYILYGVPTVKQIRANVVALDINKMLEGKVALITGGTSGIGMSIAEAFLKSGAIVIITGRNEKKIDSVLNNIKSQNVLYEHKVYQHSPNSLDIEYHVKLIQERFLSIHNQFLSLRRLHHKIIRLLVIMHHHLK